MIEDKLPDFKGKTVIFYVSGASRAIQDGIVMEYVSFVTHNNKLFVKGRLSKVFGGEWVSNLQSGIAWDSVAHYIVFDSQEDYIKRVGEARVPLLQRLFG
jgi:hypothetical protein